MPSDDLSDLVNLGIVESFGLQSDSAKLGFRGILICGLPRSGTTAFARALERLGFSLGSAGDSPVAEIADLHPYLRAAMQGGDQERMNLMRAIEIEVNDLATTHQRYIVKLPDCYRFLNEHALPRGIDLVIFVTRDPLCVAVRNSKSVGMDNAFAIKKAVNEYASLLDIAASCSAPWLLVAYEKLLAMPQDLLSAMARVLGLPGDNELLSQAVRSIVLNDGRYLKSSSLQRGEFRGEIGYFACGRIGGWGFWSGMPLKRVKIEIRSADEDSLGVGITRLIRTELVDQGIHPTGEVGFRVDLFRHVPLGQLRFIADGIEVSLRPSPKLRKRMRRNAES